jgi:hypothetical protein
MNTQEVWLLSITAAVIVVPVAKGMWEYLTLPTPVMLALKPHRWFLLVLEILTAALLLFLEVKCLWCIFGSCIFT